MRFSLDGPLTAVGPGCTIWPERSAYSGMVKLSDEHIGLLFEGGASIPHEEFSFVRVALSDLTR